MLGTSVVVGAAGGGSSEVNCLLAVPLLLVAVFLAAGAVTCEFTAAHPAPTAPASFTAVGERARGVVLSTRGVCGERGDAWLFPMTLLSGSLGTGGDCTTLLLSARDADLLPAILPRRKKNTAVARTRPSAEESVDEPTLPIL